MDTLIVMSSSYAYDIQIENQGNRYITRTPCITPAEKGISRITKLSAPLVVMCPGGDILLSTEEEIFRFYTENGRGVLLGRAVTVLRTGGYLIIDDLEKHFSKEILHMILELIDTQVSNPNGACIIFSTHYAEILDFIRRTDNSYITRRKDGLLSVSKLSAEFRRNDIKKSDLFFQRADPIWEQPLTVESSRSYRSESGKQRPKLVCRSKECFPSFMYSQLD